MLRQAYLLAVAAHGTTRRATDQHLFLDHVVDVAGSLYDTGFDDELVAVGLLHDSVERGSLKADRLRELMGPDIAELVLVLSEDPTISDFERRKAALRSQVAMAGSPAVEVYAADKLSDMLGLQRGIEMHRDGLEERMGTSVAGMVTHYRESVGMISSLEPDSIFLPTLKMRMWKLEDDVRRMDRSVRVPVGALDLPPARPSKDSSQALYRGRARI